MYDGGKVIVGLIICLGFFLSPFIYDAGNSAKPPEPQLTAKAKEAKTCVMDKSYMTSSHFSLLDKWRHAVVRDGERLFKAESGKIYNTSLQLTCMECHSNKSNFCDQCHNYMGVTPYCWDCHVAPKEMK